ncbi:hypothetical protein RQP46_005016 [Phenoliferia psychrophenolica]
MKRSAGYSLSTALPELTRRLGRVLQGYCTWSALVLLALFVKSRTSSVLNESILAIAGLGLQLSTTRGLVLSFPTLSTPLKIPLSTSRLFLPLASISDVVINEGIYGWTIIYYLVIIQDEGQGPVKLRVGYPVGLPQSPSWARY